MDWSTLFESHRFGEAAPKRRPNRNPFQIDQDRIQFSRPFRRLQQKTQVHPLPFNAHVRNRLVHTLEVASVGRSLGYAVGSALAGELAHVERTADDLGYLVQAVCLAHDIGNPPFGHAGEEVIAAWMGQWLARDEVASLGLDADLAHFDGNAQGFRILTRADGWRDAGGLRLTLATLAAFLKYPWAADDARAARRGRPAVKFGYFATEANAFAEVCGGVGLSGLLPRHPAVFLMEAADDIAYTLADLEDAVEMSTLPYARFEALTAEFSATTRRMLDAQEGTPGRAALLRSRAIGVLIGHATALFVDHAGAILAGDWPAGDGLLDRLATRDAAAGAAFDAMRRVNHEEVYFTARKVEFEIGARDVLAKALEVFAPACLALVRAGGDEAALELRARQALSLLQDYRPKPGFSPSETIRCAVDFTAGMTDNYAGWLAARLRGLQ